MIVLVGLSHHTAPIEVREKLALDAAAADQLVASLLQNQVVDEAVVVSTCNRTEVIVASQHGTEEALLDCARVCQEALLAQTQVASSYLYAHRGLAGIRHLLRVASSLDSLVVGEPQILGQLKQSFERARERGTVGPILHRVFSRVLRGAKRVRNETMIGAGQVSVPSIAVDLALQIFGHLQGHTVLLVGAGEMGQTVARLLREEGARLLVVGRDAQRTQAVAVRMGGEARTSEQLSACLIEADIVITSTSATGHVITAQDVIRLRKARRGRNLFFIDLAVPRDVEPQVGELDGVFLYNVDDLSEVASESAEVRRKEAERADVLVDEAVQEFQRWMEGEQVTPVIKALRSKFREAMEIELERSLRGRLRELDLEQRAAFEKMIEASINRMLHVPTMRLREQASNREGVDVDEWARIVSQVFGLGEVCSRVSDWPPPPLHDSPTDAFSGVVSSLDILTQGEEEEDTQPKLSNGTSQAG